MLVFDAVLKDEDVIDFFSNLLLFLAKYYT